MRKHVNLHRDFALDYVHKHEKLNKPRVRKHEKLHTRTAQKNIVYYKGAREPLTKSLNVRVNTEDYKAKTRNIQFYSTQQLLL